MAVLQILYRDAGLVAVNKPAGYLVHPADEPQDDDQVVMKILRDQIGQRVNPIHRIDRPTSGVVLLTLDSKMTRQMNLLMDRRKIEKSYVALVEGECLSDEWLCCDALSKKENAPPQEAQTRFRVLERYEVLNHQFAKIECQPATGRYHQIRRHLLGAGLPIVGDYRYAGIEKSDYLGTLIGSGTRMFLQAKSLKFRHPESGMTCDIEAPLDPIFSKISLRGALHSSYRALS